MIDEKEIMPYNFFAYGGVYTGEHHGMRYKIERIGEKPDFQLEFQVWQGPFASIAVPDEKKTIKIFEYSEEGRAEGIAWIRQQYDTRTEEWENAPSILEAQL
jgi:hypothetical protein